ncbi:hypothetical protein EJ06DRAFT_583181 [Trichodelitschia bisporula]|uniref:Uncharacterized protein n=1 Tax=Trichodelitschia bisporula TaxID=703511 RepID=A0A6G1HTJ6_9PEZI|nr:hypothetical protein EJ06DRAFT_583181 [Trichodelitschia bisporula]
MSETIVSSATSPSLNPALPPLSPASASSTTATAIPSTPLNPAAPPFSPASASQTAATAIPSPPLTSALPPFPSASASQTAATAIKMEQLGSPDFIGAPCFEQSGWLSDSDSDSDESEDEATAEHAEAPADDAAPLSIPLTLDGGIAQSDDNIFAVFESASSPASSEDDEVNGLTSKLASLRFAPAAVAPAIPVVSTTQISSGPDFSHMRMAPPDPNAPIPKFKCNFDWAEDVEHEVAAGRMPNLMNRWEKGQMPPPPPPVKRSSRPVPVDQSAPPAPANRSARPVPVDQSARPTPVFGQPSNPAAASAARPTGAFGQPSKPAPSDNRPTPEFSFLAAASAAPAAPTAAQLAQTLGFSFLAAAATAPVTLVRHKKRSAPSNTDESPRPAKVARHDVRTSVFRGLSREALIDECEKSIAEGFKLGDQFRPIAEEYDALTEALGIRSVPQVTVDPAPVAFVPAAPSLKPYQDASSRPNKRRSEAGHYESGRRKGAKDNAMLLQSREALLVYLEQCDYKSFALRSGTRKASAEVVRLRACMAARAARASQAATTSAVPPHPPPPPPPPPTPPPPSPPSPPPPVRNNGPVNSIEKDRKVNSLKTRRRAAIRFGPLPSKLRARLTPPPSLPGSNKKISKAAGRWAFPPSVKRLAGGPPVMFDPSVCDSGLDSGSSGSEGSPPRPINMIKIRRRAAILFAPMPRQLRARLAPPPSFKGAAKTISRAARRWAFPCGTKPASFT